MSKKHIVCLILSVLFTPIALVGVAFSMTPVSEMLADVTGPAAPLGVIVAWLAYGVYGAVILFNSAAGILTAAVGYQAPVKPARIASAILLGINALCFVYALVGVTMLFCGK